MMISVQTGVPSLKVDEAVFFPFDSYSIPMSFGLQLGLVPGKTPGRANPIVLDKRDKKDTPDRTSVAFYGTVICVDGEYRMWYLGSDEEKSRILYAVSKDGIKWLRPDLGLVEYLGSMHNNIVDFPQYDDSGVAAFIVLYDPEDLNPERRFKMVFERAKYNYALAVALSRDGLSWHDYSGNPIGRFMLEPSGLIKFNGCYYVNGQEFVSHPIPGRLMVTYASYDFEHWSEATALSFIRHNQRELLSRPAYSWNAGEQVHLGASLWNRGNVIIGFYGQWHGPENNDRRFVSMDIGLVVSNDAIHFREPIPDFRIIPSYEDLEMQGTRCALAQGQAFENIGDKTFVWYGLWQEPGGVRLATWPRDRLGYFEVIPKHKLAVTPHFISCPLEPDRPNGQVFINADGLSENSYLRVEICDYKFQKLPGYSGDDSIPIKESGLRVPVRWRNKEALEKFDFPIRVRVNFEGLRPEDARVYAVYISPKLE